MQEDQLGKSFGLVIGFLVPGLIGLYAMSLHIPAFQSWFTAATVAQTTVGGFLLLIISSAGMGVFLSGVRWYVLENVIKKGTSTSHDIAQRRTTQTELVYQNMRRQHYDFYLFYSNTLVALVVLWASWLPRQLSTAWPFSMITARLVVNAVLMVVVGLVLYASAKDAYRRYQEKRAAVLKVAAQRETA